MYLARTGQEEEELIGYIESWRILKPTAETPDGNNDWVRELLDLTIRKENPISGTAYALQTLYTPNGEIRNAIALGNVRIPGGLSQGTSPIADFLGPQGTEIVYISAIWIDYAVSTIARAWTA